MPKEFEFANRLATLISNCNEENELLHLATVKPKFRSLFYSIKDNVKLWAAQFKAETETSFTSQYLGFLTRLFNALGLNFTEDKQTCLSGACKEFGKVRPDGEVAVLNVNFEYKNFKFKSNSYKSDWEKVIVLPLSRIKRKTSSKGLGILIDPFNIRIFFFGDEIGLIRLPFDLNGVCALVAILLTHHSSAGLNDFFI